MDQENFNHQQLQACLNRYWIGNSSILLDWIKEQSSIGEDTFKLLWEELIGRDHPNGLQPYTLQIMSQTLKKLDFEIKRFSFYGRFSLQIIDDNFFEDFIEQVQHKLVPHILGDSQHKQQEVISKILGFSFKNKKALVTSFNDFLNYWSDNLNEKFTTKIDWLLKNNNLASDKIANLLKIKPPFNCDKFSIWLNDNQSYLDACRIEKSNYQAIIKSMKNKELFKQLNHDLSFNDSINCNKIKKI